MPQIYIGTAGWSIPTACAASFPSDGTHLERYARTFRCVEINSSFYRSHRPTTWTRWAESTPTDFRFSAKMPRAVTHDSGLICHREQLLPFLDQIRLLGERLGPALIQLPRSQSYDPKLAPDFLETIRAEFPDGQLAIEPWHTTWFRLRSEPVAFESRHCARHIGSTTCPASLMFRGDPSLVYLRFHGSPRMYYSSYEDAFLERNSFADRGALFCRSMMHLR